jgi:ABC-2 type transport system permease protein
LRFPRPAVVRAFARREFLTTRSYKLGFALDTLYGVLELAVYFFIARVIRTVDTASLDGAPNYFAFAGVGIIVAAVLTAVSITIAQRLRDEQLAGTLEALTAQPVSTVELCLGLVSFPFVFASVRAFVYLVVAGFLMDFDISRTSWLGVAMMLVATAFALSPFGVLSAALVLVYKRGALLGGMLIYGMTLAAGAVFPLSVLPAPLEWIGRVLPVRFAYDGVREALFTGHDWTTDVLALLAFGIVLTPLALLAFSLAIIHAKKTGSVSEY